MDDLTADLHKRSAIPKHVEVMIRSFPKDMHAMSMFGAALFALQACHGFPIAPELILNIHVPIVCMCALRKEL